jgi:hypothetical protein
VVCGGREQNYWHQEVHLTLISISKRFPALVPSCPFKVEAIHIDTLSWVALQLLEIKICDLKAEVEGINGFASLSSICLEDASDVTLGEEEAWQPESVRIPIHQPIPHELYSQVEILQP